jgi:hypothetical protein
MQALVQEIAGKSGAEAMRIPWNLPAGTTVGSPDEAALALVLDGRLSRIEKRSYCRATEASRCAFWMLRDGLERI